KHLMRDEKLARLSPQEERILGLVADGKTNREIGDELHLAEKTVKNYVSSILSKLEVARRAEAAAYLARHTTTPGAVEALLRDLAPSLPGRVLDGPLGLLRRAPRLERPVLRDATAPLLHTADRLVRLALRLRRRACHLSHPRQPSWRPDFRSTARSSCAFVI